MFSSIFGSGSEDQRSEESDPQSSSTEKKVGDLLGSFMNAAISVGTAVTETVKENAEKVSILGDFANMQKDFINKQDNKGGSDLPPWVGLDNEDEMRELILALSKDKRNFLRDPPTGQSSFVFSYKDAFASAMATLQEDPNLNKMRFELVPKVMNEERFWQNYFYRVSLIKQASEVSAMANESLEATKSDVVETFETVQSEMETVPMPIRPSATDLDEDSLNESHDTSLLKDMEDEEHLSTLEAPSTTNKVVNLSDLDGTNANASPEVEILTENASKETTPPTESPPVLVDTTPSDGSGSATWEQDLEAELEGFNEYEQNQDNEELDAGWEDEVAQMLKDEEENNDA